MNDDLEDELNAATRLRLLVDKELSKTTVIVSLELLVDLCNLVEAQQERIQATGSGDTVKVVQYERSKNAV